MGYRQYQRGASFFLPAEKKAEALKALGKQALSSTTSLEKVLAEFGWTTKNDGAGNITHIYFDGENASMEDDRLFRAIAPFVQSGSHIDMEGEDGLFWRWTFHDGELRVLDGKIVFPEAFDLDEIGNTYCSKTDRFVVSLVVGYSEEDGVATPEEVVAAALKLTQGEGSGGTLVCLRPQNPDDAPRPPAGRPAPPLRGRQAWTPCCPGFVDRLRLRDWESLGGGVHMPRIGSCGR